MSVCVYCGTPSALNQSDNSSACVFISCLTEASMSGQDENLRMSQIFPGKNTDLSMCLALQLPMNMLELFKDSTDILFFNVSF